MSIIDIAIVVAGIAFVAVLAHAAKVLGANPYQQVRAHEDLAGRKFPPGSSQSEQLSLIDRHGLSPTSSRRIVWLLLAIAVVLGALLWIR